MKRRELLSQSKEELVDQILKIHEVIEQIKEENNLIRKENNLIRKENGLFREEIGRLRKENTEQKKIIEKLKREVERAKNLPRKPNIKSSKSEICRKDKSKKQSVKKRSKKLVPTEIIKVETPKDELPPGAKLKDYQEYTVQEIETRVRVIRYEIARYTLPNGKIITAEKPIEARSGHFGPALKQYIIYQYHQNNVTQNKILEELRDKGIDISAGQINAILVEAALNLESEYEEVFEVGKKVSNKLCVDDTGEQYNRENWFCTAIQNELFVYFVTTNSKARMSFLKILCGKHINFVLNNESFNYMKSFKMRSEIIDILRSFNGKSFSSEEDFEAFLKETLLPCYRGLKTQRIAKEAALFGNLIDSGVDPNLIILSDGAGQFYITLLHALCWVHVGRPLKKYIPETDVDKADLERVSKEFWDYYRKLCDYRENPSAEQKETLQKKFDTVFSQSVRSEELAAILCAMRKKKDKLLVVLENPNIPLHNNGTESAIRNRVIKRKISGPTRSEIGRKSRDIFASLSRTCRKNKISFWAFLGSRIRKDETIPFLPQIIRYRASNRSPT